MRVVLFAGRLTGNYFKRTKSQKLFLSRRHRNHAQASLRVKPSRALIPREYPVMSDGDEISPPPNLKTKPVTITEIAVS
jgi:hypothetical protein